MRLGRLAFAGAAFLALAWFALRSPLPVADPRFLKEEFQALGVAVTVTAYLDTGMPRARGHELIADCATFLQGYAETPALRSRAEEIRQRSGGDFDLTHADLPLRGAAVDAALARLQAAGIGNATINAGGVLRAAGRRGQAPWRIGIRDPRARRPDDAIAYLLEDREEAIATFGEPAGSGLRQASVVHDDGAWAAAAAAALVAAGPQRWRATAAKLGVEQALVIDAAGAAWVTAPLGQRLKYLHGLAPTVVP